MTAIPFERPREIKAARPVRVVLANGFLGAGKTTALGALAGALTARGLTVGIITNDQAADLVDTATIRQAGLPVGEVAGGCFCCKFTDLLDAAQVILKNSPDVLLCEPVGSCTDMAATVLNPLRLFYRDVFRLAPFTVLVDPARAREAVLGETEERFPPEVGYIYRKQLEEADLIALNKVDTLPTKEAARIVRALEEKYARPVLPMSALRGEGIEAWAQRLLADSPSGTRILADLDYDTYAAGEAVLGWLNMTARLQGRPRFDARRLAERLMTTFCDACAGRGEIAHLKLAITSADTYVRANLTQTGAEPSLAGTPDSLLDTASLVVNARVRMEPGALGGIAVQAVQQAAGEMGAEAEIRSLQSFSPGYPRPPYRLREVVA